MKIIVAAIALFLALGMPPAIGQTWHDRQGKEIPESSSRKSSQSFSGMLVVTQDADWREKWETSPDVIPYFTTTEEVRIGGELAILIFFANPKVNTGNLADVTCDLKVIRPDGTVSTDLQGTECYQGPIPGNPMNIYLSKPMLRFVAESTDVPGRWSVRVTLKDNLRGVSLPLEASFNLLRK